LDFPVAGIFAGSFLESPRHWAIRTRFLSLPQRLQQFSLCIAGRENRIQ
jgi:hypothetical protein